MKYLFILLALLFPSTLFAAASYDLLAPILGTTTLTSLKDYLLLVFRAAIGLAGVLAVVMIVVCGIKLMGNPSVSGKSEAKECIWNAIFGVILILGSWLLLNTINPLLLNNDIALVGIASAPTAVVTTPTGNDPMPTISGYYYRFDSAGVIKNSPKYSTAATCDQLMKKAQSEGVTVTQTCFYIPKPAEPGPSASETSTRTALCGNGSCLNEKPFGVNNKPCRTPGGSSGESCTNLAGLPLSTISFIKGLPYSAGGGIMITGGTEFNLHKSHRAGKPIFDLRFSKGDALDNMLKALPKKSSFCGNFKYLYGGYVFTDEIYACGARVTRHWHVCQLGTLSSTACQF